MKIHSLAIRNMRALRHLELENLPETGVVVISGPNETGKSTIVEAIDLVLREKHSANTKQIRTAKTIGVDEPLEITLEASMGPYRFKVHKSFAKSKKCELTIYEPRHENLDGREAETRLEEIYAQHVDDELRTALFMKQDELEAGLLTTGIPAVKHALDEAINEEDTLKGLENSQSEYITLIDAVEEYYGKFFTPKGNQKKTYSAVFEQLEKAQSDLAEAQQAKNELSEDVQDHERYTQQLQKAQEKLPEALAEAEALSETFQKANALSSQIEVAEEKLLRANTERKSHEDAISERENARTALESQKKHLSELKAQLQPLKEASKKEAAEVERLSGELNDAKERMAESIQVVKTLRSLHDASTELEQRRKLAAKISEIEELDKSLSKQRSLLIELGTTVNADDIRRAEQLQTDIEILEQRIKLVSAKLMLTAEEAVNVFIDGVEHHLAEDGEALSVQLDAGTEVKVGAVTASYDPGQSAEEAEKAQADLQRKSQDLNDTFAQLEVSGIEQMRKRNQKQNSAKQAIKELEQRRGYLWEDELVAKTEYGQDITVLRASNDNALEKLKNKVVQLQAEVEPSAGEEELPAEIKKRESAAEQLQTKVQELEAQLQPWAKREHSTAASTMEVKVNSHKDVVLRAQNKLDSEVANISDEALQKALEQATSREQELSLKVQEMKESYKAQDLERAKDRMKSAQAVVDSHKNRALQARTFLETLKHRIAQASGAAERLQQAEAAKEKAEYQVHSTQRQAEAVSVLRETLLRHREAAHQRYAEPFSEQLTALARVVFGDDVTFELDENLQVLARTKGERAVPLKDLSGGAKEQMAIIVRFAIAGLVAHLSSQAHSKEGDVTVPVIVDDALGSTDTLRLRDMGMLFDMVGKSSQVIVMTCMPERYAGVVNKTEYSMNELLKSK